MPETRREKVGKAGDGIGGGGTGGSRAGPGGKGPGGTGGESTGTAGTTAADQLVRILYILPAASRKGGVTLEELADEMEVDRKAVMKDLTEITDRVYYHPADSGSALQIQITGERVSIWTTGEFNRPMKLSPREALCVGVALRGQEGSRASALLNTLEQQVATAAPGELLNQLDAADIRQGSMGIRACLAWAMRERESVRIRYLKPGDPEPMDRTVHPYALIHGEGSWYLPAFCEVSQEVRNFRVDRILEAATTGRGFQIPEDFDPEACIRGGRVFMGGRETPVRVRYAPGIARWIAEREPGEWDREGGFTVTHQVADPKWVVRHVLQYGPDAEILEPEESRTWIREVVAGSGFCC